MKRNQFVTTKNGRVERLSDSESEGMGVRVLLNGAWGCAAARDGLFQMRSYPSAQVGSSCQNGWEYVEGLDLAGQAPRIAEQATALVRADECPSGVTTVVLDADQLALQVHESVGHPT